MNSQELRALQEAYIEVVMNEDKVGIDDKLSSGKTPRQKMKTKASNLDMDANIAGGVASSPSWRTSKSIRLGAKEQESSLKKRAKKIREVETNQQEQTDLYDIILSHLLDEGYADTEQAAEAIMVNMSEDWRESICEAAKDQSDKQIEKGVKTTYKAQNVLDNLHQGRSRGVNRTPYEDRDAKVKRMRGRLKTRRDDLFGERNNREDVSRAEFKKKYGF